VADLAGRERPPCSADHVVRREAAWLIHESRAVENVVRCRGWR